MTEWLALTHGRVRRVVTIGDELVSWPVPLERSCPRPPCSCGRPRLGSGQSCGSPECVIRLHRSAASSPPPRDSSHRSARPRRH
ncbi:MAG: hypothetical protein ABSA03_12510 [Streptosporangiaceae bacterium]